MRKFCIVTKDFSGLGFGLLNKEDEVIFACNPDMEKFKDKSEDFNRYKNVGKGMADVFLLSEIMENRKDMKDWYFIWDGNHSVEENETLRKEGFKVGLGGELSYKMENDREFGIELAEKHGIESPLWEEFQDNKKGIEFLKQYSNDAFFLKPNAVEESHKTTAPVGRDPKKANEILQVYLETTEFKEGFVLQKQVIGTEVNVELFCVDGEPVSANMNLEVKRISEASLIDGYEKGTMCGCAFDVCRDIPIDSKLVQETIGKMLPFIKEEKYTGFADINCIIENKKVWFIEWCWRCGYNMHPNYFMNIAKKDFLNTVADIIDKTYKPEVKEDWGASVTIYTDFADEGVPMDIPEDIKQKVFLFDGMIKNNHIIETGASNDLMIIGGYGKSIQAALLDAYTNLSKMSVIKSDYRSDGLNFGYNSSPLSRYEELEKMGLI